MADPSSLVISIDRTSMTLAPLILAGNDTTRSLSIATYREPAMQPRITYAPTGDTHGDMPLSWSYQETLHAFNVFDEGSTSEATTRAKIAELVAALGRLTYTMTVTVDGAPAETWTCRPGTVAPVDDRNSTDLQTHDALWAVTIPAYPIRSVA